jgi:N-acyl amino acid synthase FeeM
MQNIAQNPHQPTDVNMHHTEPQPISCYTSLLPPYNKKTYSDINSYSNAQALDLETSDVRNKNDCLLKRNNYSIHLVDSLKQRLKTNTLIKRMYASRGYHTETATTFSHSPNQITFAASIGEIIVGTVTLGIDSDEGLLTDELYQQEINSLREKGRKVCELSKLAINPLHTSKKLLASLFNLAYINGRINNKATDFVIEVNPRHAGYYKRLLGFRQIGEVRTCKRVNAPAVLLHLELDYVDEQVSCLAGSHESKQRSIYTHFLTKHEEEWVANKIQCRLIEQLLYSRLQSRSMFPALYG